MSDKTDITFDLKEGSEDDTYVIKIECEYKLKLEKETFESDKERLEYEKELREGIQEVLGEFIDEAADELEAIDE